METLGPDACSNLAGPIISPAHRLDWGELESKTKYGKEHVGVCLLFVISSLPKRPVLLRPIYLILLLCNIIRK